MSELEILRQQLAEAKHQYSELASENAVNVGALAHFKQQLAEEREQTALFRELRCQKCGHHAHPDDTCGHCLFAEAQKERDVALERANKRMDGWTLAEQDLKQVSAERDTAIAQRDEAISRATKAESEQPTTIEAKNYPERIKPWPMSARS